MGRAGDWAQLCRLLDDDESLERAVQQAIAMGEDPWQALLDGLDDAGALAYLQADDTGMELTDALEQLPRVVQAHPDLGEATDTDDLVEATAVADRVLSEDRLGIVRLVEDADAWPLVVVPLDRVDRIIEAAASLEHEATRAD